MSGIDDRTRDALSALLDGALDEAEAAALRRRLKDDPALRREYDLLRRTVEAVRGLPRVPAPPGLGLGLATTTRPRRRLLRIVLPLAAAAAAAALLAVLLPDDRPASFELAKETEAPAAPATPAGRGTAVEPGVQEPSREDDLPGSEDIRRREVGARGEAAEQPVTPPEPHEAGEMEDAGDAVAEALVRETARGGKVDRTLEEGEAGKGTAREPANGAADLLRRVERGAAPATPEARAAYLAALAELDGARLRAHFASLPRRTPGARFEAKRGSRARDVLPAQTFDVRSLEEARSLGAILQRAFPVQGAARVEAKGPAPVAPATPSAPAFAAGAPARSQAQLSFELQATPDQLEDVRAFLEAAAPAPDGSSAAPAASLRGNAHGEKAESVRVRVSLRHPVPPAPANEPAAPERD